MLGWTHMSFPDFCILMRGYNQGTLTLPAPTTPSPVSYFGARCALQERVKCNGMSNQRISCACRASHQAHPARAHGTCQRCRPRRQPRSPVLHCPHRRVLAWTDLRPLLAARGLQGSPRRERRQQQREKWCWCWQMGQMWMRPSQLAGNPHAHTQHNTTHSLWPQEQKSRERYSARQTGS
jgi:hypothetical protein